MKRQRKMMALLAVLAVCIGAAFGISRINFDENMTGTQTAIIDVDSSDITGLSWNYEEEVSFTCQDEKWTYDGDEKMPVNQEKMTEIAQGLSSIISDKRVEEVKSLSLYGLSDPAYTLTVKTADKSWEISIGDESFSDGEVYISTGDEYVYLTDSSLIDKISYTLYDLVQEEEIPEMESIHSITIEKEESPVHIVFREDSGYCYSDAYTYYLEEDGSYRNLDNDNTKTSFDTLSAFTWEACVDYYADDSELKSYGLDAADAVISIAYTPVQEEDEANEENKEEKASFEYEVGSADDDYYARLSDSRMVYRISSEVYDAAVNASYDELRPDEVILLDWDTVDSIDIEADGSRYTVELEKKKDDEYICTFNGEEIEFTDVLDELSGILLDEEKEAEPTDSREELKLTFHRNTEEYASVELVFYQYDGSSCISVLNGEETNCVNREDVISLKEAINSIILDSNSKT